jgi:hypothetical protein
MGLALFGGVGDLSLFFLNVMVLMGKYGEGVSWLGQQVPERRLAWLISTC